MSFFKLDSTDPDHENLDVDLTFMEAMAVDDEALESLYHSLEDETESAATKL